MAGSETPAGGGGPEATDEPLGDRTCRVCGAPSGIFEECERCFLDRLESHFDTMLIGPRPRPQRRPHRPAFEPSQERRRPALRPKAPRWLPWIEPKPEQPAVEPAAEAPVEAEAPPPEPTPPPEPEAPAEAEPEPEAAAAPEATALPAATPPPPEPEAPAAEEPAAEAAPSRRRPSRGLLIGGGLVAVALVAVLALTQGEDEPAEGPTPAAEEPTPAAEEPPPEEEPPPPEEGPPPQPLLGVWTGEIEVRYSDGTTDELAQTLRVTRLEQGERAGFSRSVQNETTCRGPITFLGESGDGYRFRYRELNTEECIAEGEMLLTPRGDSRLEYREITDASVNRGTLRRD